MLSMMYLKRTVLGAAGAVALTAAIAMPSFAQDTVTQEITGNAGDLSAVVADATMSPVAYNNEAQGSTGNLVLSVDDGRGTSEGWHVTISSSDFVYGGASTLGIAIPATGFVITTPGTPVLVLGQPVDGTGGPNAGIGGSLNAARETISAEVGFGSGTYTQQLPVTLAIPAFSQTGTYVADLTVLISSAP